MNNKEVMIALLNGYKICNPRWGCKYAHLKGDRLITDDGSPMDLILRYDYSGLTKIYMGISIEGDN